MAKYDELHGFLMASDKDEIVMSFNDIIELIERPLPRSAYAYNAWWANNSLHKSQSKAWMRAGYEVCNLDRVQELVTFKRVITT